MLKWKTLIGILLLVAVSGCQLTLDPSNPEKQALRDLTDRIEQFEVVKKENQLTLDIMKLQREIAQMKASSQLSAQPVRQRVNTDELPPDMK